jgi:hypothetical protein
MKKLDDSFDSSPNESISDVDQDTATSNNQLIDNKISKKQA